MLLLLIPSIAFVVLLPLLIVVGRVKDYNTKGIRKRLYFWFGPISNVFTVVTIVLCALLIISGIGRLGTLDLPAKYLVVQQTIDDARAGTMAMERNPYEDAAILNKVVKMNQRLAGLRYWNDNIWTDWMVLDEAANIPYIK